VKNGLNAVSGDGLVAVHDGVRPLVSTETLNKCFNVARRAGNAVPVIPIAESVREIWQGGSKPVDREKLRIVQTPQVFRIGLLKEAYKVEYQSWYTDDAAVVEHSGIELHLVDGNRENIKITTPADLAWAEWIKRGKEKE
jgi:2-C-methyl-D-erythritol 4-phosphate cytidylyltransferase